jgi:protein-S-isoprenylcysteine O-methyltransferase Ste14
VSRRSAPVPGAGGPRTGARAAAVDTVVFAVAVPGTVAGVVPWRLAGRHRGGRPAATVGIAARALGGGLVVAGGALVADAFVRFVRAGGTPAPVAETEDLVVDGPYRRTRNPQYVGVIAIVAGQGLRWGSRRVLAYAVALALSFHTWVRCYEEPRLRHRFGTAYARYEREVPRWSPRLGTVRGRRRGPSAPPPR